MASPPAIVRRLAPLAYMPAELSMRVLATLADKTLPVQVFNTLLALSELADPHGAPVPLRELQRYASTVMGYAIAARKIKSSIKVLIEQYGIAIGSARGARHGYFFVTTDDEARAAAAPLLAEIRSLAKRCHTLSPTNPYVQHLMGQMEVHLGS